MAAGRHLGDVRAALGQAVGHPVDYLFVDVFVVWANQQGQPDVWADRISQWRRELMPEERMRARLDGETRARQLLESKLGRFSEDDLRQFVRSANADWWRGSPNDRRFSPAMYRPQEKMLVESLEAFNRWVPRIWQGSDAELDRVLDEFWTLGEVWGAGVTLPSTVLYLRNPDEYNVWLEIMSKGLAIAAGFSAGRWRTAEGYRHFNNAMVSFRERYGLVPQELDVIMWKIERDSRVERPVVAEQTFRGFTDDTFRFLQELADNNSQEWFDANKERYARVLRDPLRALFRAVAPTADPALETEAKVGKVLSQLRKRFPDEEGPYHPYLWGAFYRRGFTKQTDSQLFVIVHAHQVNVGLSVAGAQGSQALERFRRNLQQEPDLFLQLLRDQPGDFEIGVSERHGAPVKTVVDVRSEKDLQRLLGVELMDIQRVFPEDDPLLGQPEFADKVAELFGQLHGLHLFMVADERAEVEAIRAMLEGVGGEAEEEPLYSLEKLCEDTFLDEVYLGEVGQLLREKQQIIFYGPPGTGKTWVALKFAEYWVQAARDPGGEVEVVQFHPSYAYEEFVEGIRPESVEGPDARHELTYPIRKGTFLRFCERARAGPERRYVLVLDEINRGELPRILGELLYLLEYRRGSVTLPYSGEKFSVPANVYLLGTMNTADRSIAMVDQALRRRFHFIMLRPSPDILRAFLEGTNPEMSRVAELLDLVNRRLEVDGIEWHRHIGHSHFMREDLSYDSLRLIWKHSIVPSLEEYFYRRPERLAEYDFERLATELGLE